MFKGDNEDELVVVVYGKKLLDEVCLELQGFIKNKEKKVQLSLLGISYVLFIQLKAFAKSKSVHVEEEVNMGSTLLYNLRHRNGITLIGGNFDVLLVEDYIRSRT